MNAVRTQPGQAARPARRAWSSSLLLAVPGVASARLKDRISAALDPHGMGGSGTSVAVFDLTTKQYLYQLRPDVLRLPASNEKLVTSSTALAGWTATYRFSTQLFLDARPRRRRRRPRRRLPARPRRPHALHRVLPGESLGHGDRRPPGLRRAACGRSGVTRVTGRVMADDGLLRRRRSVANWRPSVIAYCGPLSALTLNESFSSGGGYVDDPALAAASALTQAAARRRHPRGARAGPRRSRPSPRRSRARSARRPWAACSRR